MNVPVASPPSGASEEGQLHARAVEMLTGRLLSVGVLVCLLVIVAGLVLSFVQSPVYLTSASRLDGLTKPGASFPHTPGAVLHGISAGRGPAIVMLGVLLLIATPVLRVAALLNAFVSQRDRALAVITAVVLGLLIVAFALGRGSG